MSYLEEMAIALRMARSWMPDTPHGEIVKKRINRAIERYELRHPGPEQHTFRNRLMRSKQSMRAL
jgi:hypothetical protein